MLLDVLFEVGERGAKVEGDGFSIVDNLELLALHPILSCLLFLKVELI